jgi:hypothetical protein
LEQKIRRKRNIRILLLRRDKMSRVKKSFPSFVLLFSLVACSQVPLAQTNTPTFTPYVGGTETALASLTPTPWFAGTETALAADLASPTPWVAGTETALAIPSPIPAQDTLTPLPTIAFPTITPVGVTIPDGTFSPVFFGKDSFLLLGGFKLDQGWISAENAPTYVNSEAGFDFFSPNGSFRVPSSPLEFSPTCRNYFMRSPAVLPEPMVGVASGWVSEKRATQELSADDPSYIQAVTEWFQSQGNSPADVRLTRILQVDIEGDGVDEVLLSASFFKDPSGHMSETGDYSVVLMRRVIGNQVLTIPLVKDYYVSSVPGGELSYPKTYTLVDALDLNQDGTLEVVIGVSHWEGGGAIVYRVDGQNVREVMRAIC